MIVYEGPGDLFNCRSQTLTCTTNVVGAMGKGVAKEFRDRVPGLYGHYQKLFPPNMRIPDDRTLVYQLHVFTPEEGKPVLLFPTKEHWRFPSQLSWIRANLDTLVKRYEELGITSLAMSALGCGNGGLDYENQVRPLIFDKLDAIPLPVEILLR